MEILTHATHVNGWFPAVYMSCMSQNFHLCHVSNLSVRNFRIFLLMYTGSMLPPFPAQGVRKYGFRSWLGSEQAQQLSKFPRLCVVTFSVSLTLSLSVCLSVCLSPVSRRRAGRAAPRMLRRSSHVLHAARTRQHRSQTSSVAWLVLSAYLFGRSSPLPVSSPSSGRCLPHTCQSVTAGAHKHRAHEQKNRRFRMDKFDAWNKWKFWLM